MKKKAVLKNSFLTDNCSQTTRRFPLPIICIIFLTATLLTITLKIIPQNHFAIKFVMLFINGFFALTSIKLCSESNKWESEKYFFWSAISFLVIGFISLTASEFETFFLAAGLALSIMVTPFFRRKVDDVAYCNFKSLLISNVFFALLIAAILMVGTYLIFISIGYLFDFQIDSRIYNSTIAVYLSLFVPLYILSSLPEKFSKDKNKHSKGVKFITTNILLPLVLAYLVVLYAYIIKIILVWELPNGGLTYMICGFGIIGIITHFLAYPLSNHDSKLLKLFCRYFYHSLAIPVSVLFLAIIVRVNEYGITEERYLVTIIAIWFAASCSYVILHQAQKLKLVPIIVAALFIFSSFGPWSASRVSGSSQVERLKELLIKEKLLQNGKIIKTTQAKSFEYNKKVSYIISYLVATKKIDLIQNWFPRHNNIGGIDNECKKHSHFEHRWQDEYYYVQILMQDMGLQYVDFWQNEETPKSVEFSMKNAPDFYDSINEVKGFDYVANFNLDSRKGAFRKIKTPSHDFKLLTFINGDKLIVSDRDKNGIEFDLQQLMEQLKNAPDQEDNFIAYGENKKFHVKLYFTYIKATDSRNFNEKNYSINCVMLIKMLK